MTHSSSPIPDHAARFSELLERCDRYADSRADGQETLSEEDYAPILELASVGLVMTVCGDSIPSPGRAFEHFRRLGTAFLDLVIASDDEDALLMLSVLSAAQDALEGELRSAKLPKPLAKPTEAAIVGMLRLKPSELASGEVALALLHDAQRTADVRVLVALERHVGSKSLLRAAKSAATVRGPSEGRSIYRDDDADFELVLFAGTPRELAIYADSTLELEALGDGFTETGRTGGYLIGSLAPKLESLHLQVLIGDATFALSLDVQEQV